VIIPKGYYLKTCGYNKVLFPELGYTFRLWILFGIPKLFKREFY